MQMLERKMKSLTAKLLFYFVFAAVLTTGHSLLSIANSCSNAMARSSDSRGVNRLHQFSTDPLFSLHVTSQGPESLDEGSHETYTVEIFAENDDFPFIDARISLWADGHCGIGSLTYNHKDFFDVRQTGPTCPRVLMTKEKPRMTELPLLTWVAPACGCVHFRSMVITDNDVSYIDDEDIQDGFLTKTVCIHPKATREVHLSALCQVQERYSAAEIMSRSSFLQRHQLEARTMDRHGVEMGLELRRSDNILCCSKASLESRLACFDDSRRRRVDRFCEDGNPDIPLTSFRLRHMRDRERKCCFLLGEHRYSCFAENSNLVPGPAVTTLDFSQDETDPVNDLAEFATPQDSDVKKMITTTTTTMKNPNEDDENSNEEHTVYNEDVDRTINTKPTSFPTKVKRPKENNVKSGSAAASSAANLPGQGKKQSSGERHRPATNKFAGSSSEKRKSVKNGSGLRGSDSKEGRRRGASGEAKIVRGKSSEVKPGSSERNPLGTGTWYPRNERPLTASQELRGATSEVGDDVNGKNHGGHTWDQAQETLDRLTKMQRKRDRLNLKLLCCEAGVHMGRHVHGLKPNVYNECEGSGDKYITAMDIVAGSRPCLEMFVLCCIKNATSGPVITSSEFRKSAYMSTNRHTLHSAEGMSQLDRHARPESSWRGSREQSSFEALGRDTPEFYERQTEKRFQSMRNVDNTTRDDEEDDEYNGPSRFDDVDNNFGNEDEILDRNNKNAARTSPNARPDEEADDFDERDFTGVDDIDERQDDRLESSYQFTERDKKHRQVPVPQDRHGHTQGESKLAKTTHTSRARENAFLLAKYPGGSSRRTNHKSRRQPDRFQTQNSRRSSKEARSSRKTSQERRHVQSYPSYSMPFKMAPVGKIGTLDSQEMAAQHIKRFNGALDSKEMVDAHKNAKMEFMDFVNDSPRQHRAKRKYRKRKGHYRSF